MEFVTLNNFIMQLWLGKRTQWTCFTFKTVCTIILSAKLMTFVHLVHRIISPYILYMTPLN